MQATASCPGPLLSGLLCHLRSYLDIAEHPARNDPVLILSRPALDSDLILSRPALDPDRILSRPALDPALDNHHAPDPYERSTDLGPDPVPEKNACLKAFVAQRAQTRA